MFATLDFVGADDAPRRAKPRVKFPLAPIYYLRQHGASSCAGSVPMAQVDQAALGPVAGFAGVAPRALRSPAAGRLLSQQGAGNRSCAVGRPREACITSLVAIGLWPLEGVGVDNGP